MARTPHRRKSARHKKNTKRRREPREKTTRSPAIDAAPPENPGPDFPIVGVGASAGGLEAFSQLLSALPAHPRLAIILIQHLAPQHASALPTLLSGISTCPVVQAQEGMRVEADHIYVIPPNVQMGITNGELHLNP